MTKEEALLTSQRVLVGELTEAQLIEQLKAVDPDIAVNIIKTYGCNKYGVDNLSKFFMEFASNYPDFVQHLKDKILCKQQ